MCFAKMANTGLVATPTGDDDRTTVNDTSSSSKSGTTRKTYRTSSIAQETRLMYMSAIRKTYVKKGYSSKSIDIMLRSWRKSTFAQYCVYAKLWFEHMASATLMGLKLITPPGGCNTHVMFFPYLMVNIHV